MVRLSDEDKKLLKSGLTLGGRRYVLEPRGPLGFNTWMSFMFFLTVLCLAGLYYWDTTQYRVVYENPCEYCSPALFCAARNFSYSCGMDGVGYGEVSGMWRGVGLYNETQDSSLS